ncbi:MAG TPA: MFS transporter [Clostridia bacterium]|nr:MFS transporter [Clostridia bacterium]
MTIRSRKAVRAFRHRNYRLFFGGQLISLIGTWMQQVAQAWLVLVLTGDPFWLGVVTAAQFVPVLFFGLFAGIVADALPKRQTLIVVQAAMMALAALLAVLTATGVVEVWMIVLLALGLGTLNAIDMPVRQAFVVEIVGREDVGNAIVLNSAMFNGARIVGPAAAGLTIGAFGPAIAFTINAISYLAVIAALAAMRADALRTPVGIDRPHSLGEVGAQLREGIGYVRHTPPVLLAILMIGLVSTFGMNFQVVVPVLARDVLDAGAAGFGFLMTASGIGSLGAALWLAVMGGAPRPIRLVGGAILLGAAEVLLAVSNLFPVSMLLMLLMGAGGITMAATANTTIQLNVPDRLRGRVMSVFTTVFAGSSPIGGLLMGSIASAAGIAVAVGIGGGLTLLVGLAALAWIRAQAGFQSVPVATPAPLAAPGLTGAAPPAPATEASAASRVEGAAVADAVAGSGSRPR